MKKLFFKLALIALLFASFTTPHNLLAQDGHVVEKEKVYEGVIVNISESSQDLGLGEELKTYHITARVTKGDIAGQTVTANMTGYASELVVNYKVGDRVMLSSSLNIDQQEEYYVTDHVRYPALGWLLLLFIATVVVVAKKWGVRSLLGLVFSFAIIFLFILPQILAGKEPITTAIIGGILIMSVTFYLSHGVNRKTHIALFSTAITLIITGIIAKIFVELTQLTGYSSEEAFFLQGTQFPNINIKGLLFAGILVGVLGVLDDITISQAAVVQAIKNTDPKIKPGKLFVEAMKVGHDHIASMVNTLVLVYAGSAFPLLLLFTDSQRGVLEIVNYQIIAEEVVRTLVGSIGLVLAVPITTILASRYLKLE